MGVGQFDDVEDLGAAEAGDPHGSHGGGLGVAGGLGHRYVGNHPPEMRALFA
jgi:hypothetical protein